MAYAQSQAQNCHEPGEVNMSEKYLSYGGSVELPLERAVLYHCSCTRPGNYIREKPTVVNASIPMYAGEGVGGGANSLGWRQLAAGRLSALVQRTCQSWGIVCVTLQCTPVNLPCITLQETPPTEIAQEWTTRTKSSPMGHRCSWYHPQPCPYLSQCVGSLSHQLTHYMYEQGW